LTRKQTRLAIILSAMGLLGVAAALVLYSISDSIVFFYTPSELASKGVGPGTRIRLGGLVEKGSVIKTSPTSVTFVITDMTKPIKISFEGQLPDLFREGQGVIAEGALESSGGFKADTVLAKHDEKYMPKEVADRLKAQGVWRDTKTQ
jgi:cytochrome c-type biogenesis protein CcmE